MISLLRLLLIAALGLTLGLWSAERSLLGGGPFDSAPLGPWNIATKAGALDADPYTRASLARSGEIPLALGEGLQLVARVDDSRRKLSARCVYRIGPHAPAARYWTLELVDPDGFPIENPSQRYVLRSSEILRDGDGAFSIYVSAAAHAGNWLPIGADKPFALVLRLYDSPLSATAGGIEKVAAPTLHNEGCL